MGNSCSTTCCCCNGKISRCCQKDPLSDTTHAIYRRRDTDIQEDVSFTNVAFDEGTTQTRTIVCIDNETQTEVTTDREPEQPTGHQTEADRENNHQDPHATYVKHARTVIINQGPLHLSDGNGVAATFTWPSGWRAERSEQSQREAATMEALQEMRSHLTEMTEEFRRSRNEAFTSRSRPNHASVNPEEAGTHLDDRFSDLMSQMRGLSTEVSTLQTQLHEKRQRLEEEREQVMTFALALESRVAHFASNLQREQLTEFAENLYRDFNVRLLGFDCGLTFLMEAGINQWSDLIGRQVELEERIRNAMIPEEQRCNTIFRPLVQVPGDIDLRAGEPLPPAVVSATQAPVQVEHRSGEVVVQEQQPDTAFRPTDHKPEGTDLIVDELLSPASVSDVQGEQPSDNQQGQTSEQRQSVDTNYRHKGSYSAHNDDNQSQSDQTITIDRHSASDQTEKGKRHSGSDQTEQGDRHSGSDQTEKGKRHSGSDQTEQGDRHSGSDQTEQGDRHSGSDQTEQGDRHSGSDQMDERERHSGSEHTEKGDRHSGSDQTDERERHSGSEKKKKGDRHSGSDQTDERERHSGSEKKEKGDRHLGSDQTDEGDRHSGIPHNRDNLHLDIGQGRDHMDPDDEDTSDEEHKLFETTSPSSPAQISRYTSVLMDSASPRVFKADCANSIISVATISMLKETNERQLHVDVPPWALALLKDGDILAVTSENAKQILFIDVSRLSVIKTIHTSRLYRGIGEYSSERLVVSCCKDDDGEASVDVITWKGEVERTLATSQKLTGLSQPHYLFVHDDHVFISDFRSDHLYRLDRTTGEMTQTITDPQLQSPCQVSVDPAGKLYVASWKNGQVLKKNTADGMPKPLLVSERDAESGYGHCRCVSVTDTNLLVSWDRSRGVPMNSVLKAYHIQRIGNNVSWVPDYHFNIIHSKKPHV